MSSPSDLRCLLSDCTDLAVTEVFHDNSLEENFTGSLSHQDIRSLSLSLKFTLFKNHGVAPGDTISIVFSNGISFIIAFLAIVSGGLICAPLNPTYSKEEFLYYLKDINPKLIIKSEFMDNDVAISEAAKSLKITLTTLFTKPTKAALNYFFRDEGVLVNLKKLNAPAETLQKLEQINPGDIALYLHTSGTTSKPKGVPLSHYNLVSSVKNIVATYDLTKLDKGLLVMPLFHVHGLVCGLLAPLFSGGSLVIPVNGQFSASNFWNTVVEHQVNWYTCVPTIHKILLLRSHKEYPAFNSPNLRFIRSSSSTLSPSILYELEKTFHVPVLEAYSMTEASHMMTSNPLPSKGQRKAGTVGSAVGELVVSVRDEVNKEVATGEEGEVCVKGPSVFSGYKDNPEANEEGFMEGWFRTGDRGSKDPAGFITLTGRIKELINRGGEKISPNEIDSALLEFKGVIEAVSFGAPDPLYGEVVHAAVVIKDPEDPKKMELLLKEFLLTKLAPFKVPQVFYFSNDLPKTATGKIQRKHIASKFLNTQ